jgi:hypothetical protein
MPTHVLVLESGEEVHLPVLCNIKAPLELQMSLLVVVYECADSGVVATSNHT